MDLANDCINLDDLKVMALLFCRGDREKKAPAFVRAVIPKPKKERLATFAGESDGNSDDSSSSVAEGQKEVI